jgi:hypothetical protein
VHDARPGERIIYATGPGWLVAAARVEEKKKRTTAQQQLVAVADRLQDLADQGVVLLHQEAKCGGGVMARSGFHAKQLYTTRAAGRSTAGNRRSCAGIIDNELPPLRKVPRRPATAAERHAAAEMGRAMSAAHRGGEYPDLQPGVGFSRFDHPGWS